jgi:hypothetical protein
MDRKVKKYGKKGKRLFPMFCDMAGIFQKIEMDLLLHSNSTNSNNMAAKNVFTRPPTPPADLLPDEDVPLPPFHLAETHIESKTWYKENIKNKAGFRDVSRHIDTRKTKRMLDIKGAGKLKVFVMMSDHPDFDDRANTEIVYKYAVCGGGDDDYCPQGTAYVIFYENKKKPKKK